MSGKPGRPRKYLTEEERKEARRGWSAKWREENREYVREQNRLHKREVTLAQKKYIADLEAQVEALKAQQPKRIVIIKRVSDFH